MDVTWRRRWRCPLCPYINNAADRDGIAAHKTAHKYPLTDEHKERLWADMPTGYAPPRRSGW
jgi:hypothetical protein